MNYKRNINKYWARLIKAVLAFIVIIVFLSGITSCSLNTIIEESYLKSDTVLDVPDIEIDEAEIGEINIGESNLKKMYDIKDEFIKTDTEIRDPFKPFYIEEVGKEDKNILILKAIYTEDQTEYAEIYYNDYRYLLKEEDIFSGVYLVNSINPDSVILLKGDELITLFLNEMVYD